MAVVDEHFVPDEGKTLEDYLRAGDRTAVHHLIRYMWVSKVLAGLDDVHDVLDVACGSGYGSHMIAVNVPHLRVTGADYDEDAVAAARSRYEAPNLSFRVGDVVRWDDTLGERTFDCVVSFDTIEHIEHREIMMQNVVEHLDPDGQLILSTPVKGKPVLNPGWEHHKIEYSPRSLWDFLRRYFGEVLTPEEGTLPEAEIIDDLNEGDRVVYLLRMNPVVCRKPLRLRR
jgi:SAM-dependent methyltransferase